MITYKYHLSTWGGFYNEEYKKVHNKEKGDYLFDTYEEREAYIQELKTIEKDLNTKYLAISRTEGFNCHIRTVLHRVCELNGTLYHTTCDMGINYPYDAAQFHMQWKWYPGFNDYPFGESYDYNSEEYTIVQEWIEGAFIKQEEL